MPSIELPSQLTHRDSISPFAVGKVPGDAEYILVCQWKAAVPKHDSLGPGLKTHYWVKSTGRVFCSATFSNSHLFNQGYD